MNEYTRRDQVLRAYISGRVWDSNPEFGLVRELVLSPPPELQAHPMVYDFEWEVDPGHPNAGRGDLVFTDGSGRFAVVEIKFIDDRSGKTARVKRTKSRRDVCEQALRYAEAFGRRNPDASAVTAYAYTNEGGMMEVSPAGALGE